MSEINERTQKRLKMVALAYFDAGYFPNVDAAYAKISSDYLKGYPSDSWLDSFEKFEKMPNGVTVTLDAENNYGCFTLAPREQ